MTLFLTIPFYRNIAYKHFVSVWYNCSSLLWKHKDSLPYLIMLSMLCWCWPKLSTTLLPGGAITLLIGPSVKQKMRSTKHPLRDALWGKRFAISTWMGQLYVCQNSLHWGLTLLATCLYYQGTIQFNSQGNRVVNIIGVHQYRVQSAWRCSW